MAVKLIANYAKRLGLPGFSSHQFSVSVETELHDVENIGAESERLYGVLQHSVDEQIQQTGFVPTGTYGMTGISGDQNGNGGREQRRNSDAGISEKQLDLINRIVRENNANKTEVENLCLQMFGGGVRTLNRMQASNFIDALFEKYPRKNGNGQRGKFQPQEARSS
jgi:hypothetical protein